MLREQEERMNLQRMRRMWSHKDDGQPLLSAFWPRDYPAGKVQKIGNRFYKITHYKRIAGSRFFEVWGQDVQTVVRRVNAPHRVRVYAY